MAENDDNLERAKALKAAWDRSVNQQKQAEAKQTVTFAQTVRLDSYKETALDRVQPINGRFNEAAQGKSPEVEQAAIVQAKREAQPAPQPQMRLHPNTVASREVDREILNDQLSNLSAEKKSEADKQKADLERAKTLKAAWDRSAHAQNQVELKNGRENDHDRGR